MRHGPYTPRWLAGPDDGRLEYYAFAGRESGKDAIGLEEDFIFLDSFGRVWIAPMGLVYDGASNPRIFWTLTGHPLESRHIPPGAIHDQTYQTGFRLTIDPEILALVILGELSPAEICALPRVEVHVERDEADFFGLYEPLLATPGNSFAHARVFYRAVRLGGFFAWRAHVKRRAEERMPFSMLAA